VKTHSMDTYYISCSKNVTPVIYTANRFSYYLAKLYRRTHWTSAYYFSAMHIMKRSALMSVGLQDLATFAMTWCKAVCIL